MEWESHRPSAPSTPTSMSSQSTGASSARPLPYKSVNASPSVTALAKLKDEELRRKGVDDLVRILRRVEGDYKYLLQEVTSITKDANRRMQIHLMELRSLKDINQKLQDDNQELRDLCCFLDDDRQKGRKLAREWQRFGRYTASVMRSEVAAYQEKLRELEEKQEELIKDNTELKELCLYLDQERVQFTGPRDEGDGSSNGTATAHEEGQNTTSHLLHQPMITNQTMSGQSRNSNIPEQTMNYIKQLENKVRHLEDEKRQTGQRDRSGTDTFRGSSASQLSSRIDALQPSSGVAPRRSVPMGHTSGAAPAHNQSTGASKPEAVVHAMKVLQVHEQLERSQRDVGDENLDDKEKAIVREMCNVVWRKLGDVAPERNNPRSGHPESSAPSRQGYPLPPTPDSFSPPPPAPGISSGPQSLGYQSPPPPPGYNPPSSMDYHSANGHPSVNSLSSHSQYPATSMMNSHPSNHHPSSAMSYHPSAMSHHSSVSSMGHASHHPSSSSLPLSNHASTSSMSHSSHPSTSSMSHASHHPSTSSMGYSNHPSTSSVSHYPGTSSYRHMSSGSHNQAGHSGHQSSSSGGQPPGPPSHSSYPTHGYRQPPSSHLQPQGPSHTPPPSTPIPMEQPPPPAPRQMNYHQEWRQNFMDGPGHR